MSPTLDLLAWLRQRCAGYLFDIAGVFHRHGDHPWPITADDPEDLERQLEGGGHLLPLPKEPAALANILEVSIASFLLKAAAEEDGLEARRGTERGYPDIEFTGEALDGQHHALDIKVARRDRTKAKLRTESRITLYTGNTYFRFPDLHWPGTLRPFSEYSSHLDLVMIYTLNEAVTSRVEDLELIVQEAWRIASRHRSSTTREYIGAVDLIRDLREGKGAFTSAEDFYRFWRAYPFRLSKQVQRQLDRLVKRQREEIDELRRQHGDEGSADT